VSVLGEVVFEVKADAARSSVIDLNGASGKKRQRVAVQPRAAYLFKQVHACGAVDAQVLQVARKLCNVEGQVFEAFELFPSGIENGDAGVAAVGGTHCAAVLQRDDKVHPPKRVRLIAGSGGKLQSLFARVQRGAKPAELSVKLAVGGLEGAGGGGGHLFFLLDSHNVYSRQQRPSSVTRACLLQMPSRGRWTHFGVEGGSTYQVRNAHVTAQQQRAVAVRPT
jgi:hypothetical protein